MLDSALIVPSYNQLKNLLSLPWILDTEIDSRYGNSSHRGAMLEQRPSPSSWTSKPARLANQSAPWARATLHCHFTLHRSTHAQSKNRPQIVKSCKKSYQCNPHAKVSLVEKAPARICYQNVLSLICPHQIFTSRGYKNMTEPLAGLVRHQYLLFRFTKLTWLSSEQLILSPS